MRPTRKTQPFRKGIAREVNPALAAALRGRAAGGVNPQDVNRALMKRRRHGKLARNIRRRTGR